MQAEKLTELNEILMKPSTELIENRFVDAEEAEHAACTMVCGSGGGCMASLA